MIKTNRLEMRKAEMVKILNMICFFTKIYWNLSKQN